ncbi:MAG: MFS transporter [Burkholderiales bacterium]|nr:MAG: MFS transporter [Burkholderiales bacterium]
MLANLRFQVGLLAGLQALLLVNNVTLMAVTGLAGAALAENKAFATVPLSAYVLGSALASIPAAHYMRRAGRRAGYTLGAGFGFLGACISALGVSVGSLAVLCLGTLLTGGYAAFAVSYRFAAADAADAYRPDFRSRAISLVLAGGIAGGIIGPELSKFSRTLLAVDFAGTYLTLAGFAVVVMLLLRLLRLPHGEAAAAATGSGRGLAEILRQPRCWVALLAATIGYGVMNLLMVATPLAMQLCSHPYAAAAMVIEWHVVGMFLPGLVTGTLIARFGVLPILICGGLLMLACTAIALNGVDITHFFVALLLLGVGWNFMYTGATTLLTTSYQPSEKAKVQGFNDACVFAVMFTSSLSSGVLLHLRGWESLHLLAIPLVALGLLAAAWLGGNTGWRLGMAPAAR